MPKRTSLPSMLPPACSALAAWSTPSAARRGLPACSAATHEQRAARRRRRSSRRAAPSPGGVSPTITPNVKQSAAGISRIASTSRKFESGVGFSNGCAEFTLKKPPPFVPSCLIAICEAAGPSGSSCSVTGLPVRVGGRVEQRHRLVGARSSAPRPARPAPARARARAAAGRRACCARGRPRSCRSRRRARARMPRISATSTAMPVAAETKFCTVSAEHLRRVAHRRLAAVALPVRVGGEAHGGVERRVGVDGAEALRVQRQHALEALQRVDGQEAERAGTRASRPRSASSSSPRRAARRRRGRSPRSSGPSTRTQPRRRARRRRAPCRRRAASRARAARPGTPRAGGVPGPSSELLRREQRHDQIDEQGHRHASGEQRHRAHVLLRGARTARRGPAKPRRSRARSANAMKSMRWPELHRRVPSPATAGPSRASALGGRPSCKLQGRVATCSPSDCLARGLEPVLRQLAPGARVSAASQAAVSSRFSPSAAASERTSEFCARERDELALDLREALELLARGVELRPARGSSSFASSSSDARAAGFGVRHLLSRAAVITASSGSAMCGAWSAWISRTASCTRAASSCARSAFCRGADARRAIDVVAQRVGGLAGRTEREPLRLRRSCSRPRARAASRSSSWSLANAVANSCSSRSSSRVRRSPRGSARARAVRLERGRRLLRLAARNPPTPRRCRP